MNQYAGAIVHALNNFSVRIQYYKETNDIKFLNEAREWIEVAGIYLRSM